MDRMNYVKLNKLKLVGLFLVIMVVCTFISRAADSFTIPRVTTVHPVEAGLNFIVTGNGMISARDCQYVRFPDGLSIDRIYVKQGDKVKKGNPLLQFSMKEIEKELQTAQKETAKLNIQLKQKDYENSNAEILDYDFIIANALEDSKIARLDLKVAKKEYKLALTKDKAKIYKEKKMEYENKKTEYEKLKLDNNAATEAARRIQEDALTALEEVRESDTLLNGYLNELVKIEDGDLVKRRELLTKIFWLAFDNDSAKYETYQKEVESGSKAVADAQYGVVRAQQDYSNAISSGAGDMAVYQSALDAAKRTLSDKLFQLVQLSEKESKIEQSVLAYQKVYKEQKVSEIQESYEKITQAIYGKIGVNNHLTALSKAQRVCDRAIADYNIAKEKGELSLNSEKIAMKELEELLYSLENGTYDEETAVTLQEQQMEEAESRVVGAERTYQKAIREKERAEQAEGLKNKDGKALLELEKESIQLDLEDKKKAVKDLLALKNAQGIIKAPISGNIIAITPIAGKKAGQDDNIAIGLSGYEAIFLIPKEKSEYMAVKDEVSISQKGKSENQKLTISSMQFVAGGENKEEMAEVKVLLPEGDYMMGGSIGMELKKESDTYSAVIPLSTLRKDDKGTFVLVVQEVDGVLGKEKSAARRDVTVIEMSQGFAAVDGKVSREDEIIGDSTKTVTVGERIRIEEDS